MGRSWTDEQLVQAVRGNRVMLDVLRSLGLNSRGNNYRTVLRAIKDLGLDTSHFLSPSEVQATRRQRCLEASSHTPESIRSYYKTGTALSHTMKARLGWFLDASKCAICGQGRIWHGGALVLQVDHINGDNTDNRLENLRFICPNCHTQTHTFAGRKNRRTPAPKSPRVYTPQISWPDDEALKTLVWTLPSTLLAKQLGVSDVAIAKRCKRRGIPKPPPGYWAKRASQATS